MNKDNFKIGDKVELIVYDVDYLNHRISKKVNGEVYQLTDNLIVLNKNGIKESFQYNRLIKHNKIQPVPEYELDPHSYSKDIINDCIAEIKLGNKGFVYSNQQLNEVKTNFLDSEL